MEQFATGRRRRQARSVGDASHSCSRLSPPAGEERLTLSCSRLGTPRASNAPSRRSSAANCPRNDLSMSSPKLGHHGRSRSADHPGKVEHDRGHSRDLPPQQQIDGVSTSQLGLETGEVSFSSPPALNASNLSIGAGGTWRRPNPLLAKSSRSPMPSSARAPKRSGGSPPNSPMQLSSGQRGCAGRSTPNRSANQDRHAIVDFEPNSNANMSRGPRSTPRAQSNQDAEYDRPMQSGIRKCSDHDRSLEGALDQSRKLDRSDFDAGLQNSEVFKRRQLKNAAAAGDGASSCRTDFDRDVRNSAALHSSMLSQSRVKGIDEERVEKDASLVKRRMPLNSKVQELYEKGLHIILSMKPVSAGDRMPLQFSPSGVLGSPEMPEHYDCFLGRQPNFHWDRAVSMSECHAQKSTRVEDSATSRLGKDTSCLLGQLSSEMRKEVVHMRAAADRIQELAMQLAAARQEGALWRQQCEALQEENQFLHEQGQCPQVTPEAGGLPTATASGTSGISRMPVQVSAHTGGSAVLTRHPSDKVCALQVQPAAVLQPASTDAYIMTCMQGKLQQGQAPVVPVYRGGA